MKLKDKIKKSIKNWLFASEIQRINNMEKSIEDAVHRFRMASVQLDDAEKEVEECRRLITQLVDIGVEVGFHSDDHSWAVICIEGHPEYVKFLPLTHKDAHGILNFLKQFQYSKQIIDSPIAFRHVVEDRFFK